MIAMHSPDLVALSNTTLLRALTSKNRRPNLLIACKDVGVSSVVNEVLAFCAPPFHFCVMPGRLDLPATKEGTIVVTDVSALTIGQQVTLSDWLDHGSRNVQVVSLSYAPMKPLVDEGRFLEGLFYRLNVIYLDATATQEARGRASSRSSCWDRADAGLEQL
jgi:transcriptional regulator of aromatic amino acid metabolism